MDMIASYKKGEYMLGSSQNFPFLSNPGTPLRLLRGLVFLLVVPILKEGCILDRATI
jgi:hypothetical protein